MNVENALITLWSEVTQAHFLSTPAIHELTALLEERRHRAQYLLDQNEKDIQPELPSTAALVMMDHFHTLLKAELDWLERALVSLQTSVGNQEGACRSSRIL
jgi:hypothetical protein